jgi:hypothetical protein
VVTIDPGLLRDGRHPDEHGTELPPWADRGTVHWSAHGSDANHGMIGRSEQVDPASGLSSTFACSHCCPDSFYGGWIDPSHQTVHINDTETLRTLQQNALVPDAVWTREGRRLPISYLDPEAMTRIFQATVLQMLVQERCLSREFAARLLTWRHSGFQVYRAESVEPDNTPALERLCAYIGRAVLASSRVEYDSSSGAVHYQTAKGARLNLDALEWIALVTQHVPEPGEHTRHYFGHYSNAARGKRRQRAAHPPADSGDSETEDFRRECRRTWARLIQKVYEVDPLLCPDCGGRLEVIAFINAPSR